MSGHNKWSSIKHKKGAEDAKRGKIFTKHAKLIALAARGGSDPVMNPALRMAVENARAENLPRENIERAIKKGSGEDKNAAQIEEAIYEGFAPGGVAIYIETLTDNKNRTFSNLKLMVSKHGGTLGASGSVGYLFKKRGLITVPVEGHNAEEVELAAIDAGADDVQVNDEVVEIYTEPSDLMKIKHALEGAKITTKSAILTFLPQTSVAVTDTETAKKILDLISIIEEDDDVNTVYSNFDMSDDLLEKLGS